jgi:hypothetical protein
VGDTNANVMDKAVETLVAFLEKADEAQAARCAAQRCWPLQCRLATAGRGAACLRSTHKPKLPVTPLIASHANCLLQNGGPREQRAG